MRKLDKKAKAAIYKRLDRSDLLNIFGLVNLATVTDLPETEGYTDKEVRQAVIELFDRDVVGGVQFKGEAKR